MSRLLSGPYIIMTVFERQVNRMTRGDVCATEISRLWVPMADRHILRLHVCYPWLWFLKGAEWDQVISNHRKRWCYQAFNERNWSYNMLLRPSVTWNSWCYCYHASNSISHHTNDLHISIIGIGLFLCLHLCVYMWRSLRWCLPGWSDPPLHLLSAPHRDAAAAQLGRTGCCCRCLYQWHRCTLRWGLLPAPLRSWDLLSNLHRLLGPHHWWASPGNGQRGWSKCKFSVFCWMLGISLITITCKTKMTELVPSVAVNSRLSCVVSEPSWLYLYDRWTQIRHGMCHLNMESDV